MTERTRIYSFPGGWLETNDYGDGNPGSVYIESRLPVPLESPPQPPVSSQFPNHDSDEQLGA
ncbi:hypothetical protein JK358_03465 [Nocardia sp. 2]|uniref:Uncharacterized protein n=1 Tax=Nocardia acididurans TaxID=2802282 RepID=A0ABS1LZ07_9NOCA|nr:hypothetical protein [Nocardia acididurans]MBL1073445.1 hypothetical protein [Nocardia acididurans]